MTPMPNHLSTLKPHREVWRRTHLIGGDEVKRMRNGVEMVEVAWLSR